MCYNIVIFSLVNLTFFSKISAKNTTALFFTTLLWNQFYLKMNLFFYKNKYQLLNPSVIVYLPIVPQTMESSPLSY